MRMKDIWPLPSDTPKPAEDADAAATGGDAVVAVEEAWPLDTTEEAAEAALIKNLGAAPPRGGPSQPPPAASQCPAFLRRQEVLARSGDLDTEVLKVATLARKALDRGEVKPDLDGERFVKTVATRGMDSVHRQKLRQLSINLQATRPKIDRRLRIFTAVTVCVYYTGMRLICSEFVRDVKAKQGVCAQYTGFWR